MKYKDLMKPEGTKLSSKPKGRAISRAITIDKTPPKKAFTNIFIGSFSKSCL